MISDLDKRKYLRILITLKQKNAGLITQKDLARCLNISERKVNTFMRGKVYDFWMLTQFASILGFEIRFDIYHRKH